MCDAIVETLLMGIRRRRALVTRIKPRVFTTEKKKYSYTLTGRSMLLGVVMYPALCM